MCPRSETDVGLAGNGDRQDMLDRLTTLFPETGTVCYAWAFLDNHAHFLGASLFRRGKMGVRTK